MKRPVGVTVVSTLAIIGGAVMLLASLGYLGVPFLKTSLFLGVVSGISPAMLLFNGVLAGIIGITAIVFGFAGLSLKSWAWLMGLIVYGVSLVVSVIQMTVTGLALLPVLSGIVAIAVIAYLSSASVREAFGIVSDHFTTQHPSAV